MCVSYYQPNLGKALDHYSSKYENFMFLGDFNAEEMDEYTQNFFAGPKPMGGWGGGAPPPQETIRREILLSCRNFCDLND